MLMTPPFCSRVRTKSSRRDGSGATGGSDLGVKRGNILLRMPESLRLGASIHSGVRDGGPLCHDQFHRSIRIRPAHCRLTGHGTAPGGGSRELSAYSGAHILPKPSRALPLGVPRPGGVVKPGVHAGLSSRRSRVQIPSLPQQIIGQFRCPTRSGSSAGRALV